MKKKKKKKAWKRNLKKYNKRHTVGSICKRRSVDCGKALNSPTFLPRIFVSLGYPKNVALT